MMRLGGFKDASKFFKPLTAEDDAKIAQQAAQSQKEQQSRDPAVILAQVEQMKTQAEVQQRQTKARLDFVTAQATDDRERDKAIMDFMLKAAEIQAKYGAQVDIASMRAMVERERSAFQDANDVALRREAMMQKAAMGNVAPIRPQQQQPMQQPMQQPPDPGLMGGAA